MNSFYMHANKNSRSYQWICTSLRFETEACGNSEILPEIAYQHLHHRSADLRRLFHLRLHQFYLSQLICAGGGDLSNHTRTSTS